MSEGQALLFSKIAHMSRRRAVALLCAATVMRRDADEIAYRWPPPDGEAAALARELNREAQTIDDDVRLCLADVDFEAACVEAHAYFYAEAST